MIAYTIGNTKQYNKLLAISNPVKLGKSENYLGGWVWKTKEDADFFRCSELFSNIN